MSLIAAKAERLERQLLKQKGLTAGELAQRAGFDSGRGIAKSIAFLVRKGRAINHGGRRPRYTKPTAA